MGGRKEKVKKSIAKREANEYQRVVTPDTSKIENDIQKNLQQEQQAVGSQFVRMPSVNMDATTANSALQEAKDKMIASVPNAVTTESQTLPSAVKPELSVWEQMLADQRTTLTKEKTDAQKMQRYYALTDVLKTLGQMGGSLVGGAIGGDALAGATVPEFKQHRGYLESFEKAKSANEALRRLDDKEFQLRYNAEERRQEREYNEKREATNREYQAQQAELTRRFNSEQARINREWQQAVADKDFERQAALKKELAEMDQKYKLEYQAISQAHEKALKEISERIVGLQTGNIIPFSFEDGSSVEFSKADYYGLQKKYIGRKVDGKTITKENFDTVIGNNPQLVRDYYKSIGREAKFANTPVVESENAVWPNSHTQWAGAYPAEATTGGVAPAVKVQPTTTSGSSKWDKYKGQ